MELARKCSEIISDVSDSDCLHPCIYISLLNGFIFTMCKHLQYIFTQIFIMQHVPIQGSNIKAQIIEKHSLL